MNDVTHTQDNDTEENTEKKLATVSIRKMDLQVWYKTGYYAKLKGITITQYVIELLEENISNQQQP